MEQFLECKKNDERGEEVFFSIARHLLILSRHKAHLTLEVLTKAKKYGINMFILLSYTFMYCSHFMLYFLNPSKLYLELIRMHSM